ncbi:MAG: translocation/assembly module TamB domain-containing protein [Pseudomonadota bacterium]
MSRRTPLGPKWAGFALAAALVLTPVSAQEDDAPGFIARQIENALSGPGREVRVRGFEGALSRRATMALMTFADEDGIWLTLENAVLDWNRAALLRGRLSVNELSADRIAIVRQPLPAPDDGPPEPPSPEASGFSLPELPVAVNVAALSVGLLELGEPILGEEALFRLSGDVRLQDGEADLSLNLARMEAPENRISLDLAFADTTRVLALDLTVREGPGGLVSTLVGIPGSPSLALDLDGTGPLEDYTAVFNLSTQGQRRLGGEITLRGTEETGLRFAADVAGDITPIIAPDYADFFGPDVSLVADGVRAEDGALTLEQLEIGARSLALAGAAEIDSAGRPVSFALSGRLAAPDGTRVRLPTENEVTLGQAELEAAFDSAEGETWTLTLEAADLAARDLALDALTLEGGGEIMLSGATEVTARLSYAADGVVPQDPALAAALGPRIDGAADLTWSAAGPLTLRALTLGGADYGAEISGTAETADRTLLLNGSAALAAEDLSRFSAIAGQDLTGRAEIAIAGEGDVLGGLFDLTLDLTGETLSIGQETADRFLLGPVTLSTAARRDLEGTYLDRFTLDSTGIAATAEGAVGSGVSDIGFRATLKDVALLAPELEGALSIEGRAAEQSSGLFDAEVMLDGPYGLAGAVSGIIGTGASQEETDVTLDISLPDLAPIVPDVPGPISVRGTAAATGPGLWDVDLSADAPQDVALAIDGQLGGGAGDVALTVDVPDVAAFVPGVPGAVSLTGRAEERGGGQWQLDLDARLPYAATATLDGAAGPADIRLTYAARLPDIATLAPGLSGALNATGTLDQTDPGRFAATAEIDGPYASEASARAGFGAGAEGNGRIAAELDLAMPNLAPLIPALRGGLTARATATEEAGGAFAVSLDADGPFGSTADAQGTVGGGDTNATARVAVPDIGPLVPRFTGALIAEITARQAPGAPVDLTVDARAPYGVTVDLDGRIGQGQGAFDIAAAVPNIAPFAPGLRGDVALNGTVTERSDGWGVDIQSRGPATASASARGVVATEGGTSSLQINGDAPLGLINGILAPQRLEGTARFDLALNGAPGLGALAGTVSTRGAQLQLPAVNIGIEEIDVTGRLGGGEIALEARAASTEGGRLGATGPITLAGGFPADLALTLDGFTLSDPSLYRTTLDGALTLSGPIAGTGGTLAGRIDIDETELRIPSGGSGFGGAIPRVTHLGEPADVFLSRDRAGLVNLAREARGGQRGRTVYGMDLSLNAPRRIFLRGRGLDAELGGAFRITGTTRDPAPIGAIEVIRGRLDILGKRLDLSEDGRVTLGGNLVPFLELVATSDDSSDFTIVISIEGPVDAPEFLFSSVPLLPEDEILARFFFDKGLANLSPLQAAQLAASVAQLTGRGGAGILGGVREGLGVDDFNVVTDDVGETALQIGQYLTENIYTDVTTSTGGTTEININIDVTDDVTVKGSADNEGETSLGIFYERDY